MDELGTKFLNSAPFILNSPNAFELFTGYKFNFLFLRKGGKYTYSLKSPWRLKSPASRLFTQSFIQTQIKENIKAPRHRHLCGEFIGTGEFPAQRASNAENVSIWWRHHVYVKN